MVGAGARVRVRAHRPGPHAPRVPGRLSVRHGDLLQPVGLLGRLAGPLHEIEKDYGARLRVIFRNFPFATHEHAREAAYAAEAAGLQGHFWEMHDLLYREQANWSKTKDVQPLFTSYAGMLGLNLDRFKTDMSSEKVKEKVESDQNRGEALGVKNTPTIFINNQSVPPTSLNPIALRAAIDAALREKKAPE